MVWKLEDVQPCPSFNPERSQRGCRPWVKSPALASDCLVLPAFRKNAAWLVMSGKENRPYKTWFLKWKCVYFYDAHDTYFTVYIMIIVSTLPSPVYYNRYGIIMIRYYYGYCHFHYHYFLAIIFDMASTHQQWAMKVDWKPLLFRTGS